MRHVHRLTFTVEVDVADNERLSDTQFRLSRALQEEIGQSIEYRVAYERGDCNAGFSLPSAGCHVFFIDGEKQQPEDAL